MKNNLFDISNLPRDAEQVESLLECGDIKLERLVSFGHPTPPGQWYDQPQAEWVALLKGTAILLYADGTTVELGAGDTLLIKPHVLHRVDRVSEDAVWLALFI